VGGSATTTGTDGSSSSRSRSSALGSLSAAVSQGFVWLIASIAVAGMGASTLYPSSAVMVANRVALEIRGRTLGQYSAIGTSVFTIGPLMAGLLTEAIS
jgi:MFS family permease